MGAKTPPDRFKFQASEIGVRKWVCPRCGNFNSTKFGYHSYSMDCKNRNCQAVFGTGLVLYDMPHRVKRRIPWDTVLPGENCIREKKLDYNKGVNRIVYIEDDNPELAAKSYDETQ